MIGYHGLRRRNTAQPPPPRRPGPPRLADVADDRALVATFDRLARTGGQAPGPDGLRFRDFSRADRAGILRDVAEAIRRGAYRPGPARPVPIPKRGGGTRVLRVANVVDRVVAARANEVLSPHLDPTFSPRSHGFRPGRGVWTVLAALEAEVASRGLWVLTIDDARKAFDEVGTKAVSEALGSRVADPGLAALINVLVRGAEGPGRSKGIDQGSALSPLGLNAALHANHDVPLFHERGRPGFRYADNLAYPSRSLTEGNEVLDEAAALLANANLVFKGGNARHLVDLSRGDEVPLLGLILRKDGDAIAYQTDETAWDRLGEHLRDAHLSEDPPETTRAVVGSWISSLGPALEDWTENDLRRVTDIARGYGVEELDPADRCRELVRDARARWGAERLKALEAARGESRVT